MGIETLDPSFGTPFPIARPMRLNFPMGIETIYGLAAGGEAGVVQ